MSASTLDNLIEKFKEVTSRMDRYRKERDEANALAERYKNERDQCRIAVAMKTLEAKNALAKAQVARSHMETLQMIQDSKTNSSPPGGPMFSVNVGGGRAPSLRSVNVGGGRALPLRWHGRGTSSPRRWF